MINVVVVIIVVVVVIVTTSINITVSLSQIVVVVVILVARNSLVGEATLGICYSAGCCCSHMWLSRVS